MLPRATGQECQVYLSVKGEPKSGGERRGFEGQQTLMGERYSLSLALCSGVHT